jgi:hypothetical protein
MTRSIAAVACTLALVLAAPLAGEARTYTRKKCIPPAGQSTWICKASETCCYDWLTRRGTCSIRRCC